VSKRFLRTLGRVGGAVKARGHKLQGPAVRGGDDRLVLHPRHVVGGDDVEVAGRRASNWGDELIRVRVPSFETRVAGGGVKCDVLRPDTFDTPVGRVSGRRTS
jgi:hypothetical protein